MQKIYFKIRNTPTNISLDTIMGRETGGFNIPKMGQTLRFIPVGGEKPTKYQNKIFRVDAIHCDVVSDDNGNLTDNYTIGLSRINTSLQNVLNKKLDAKQ